MFKLVGQNCHEWDLFRYKGGPTESPCIFLYEDTVKNDGHQDRRDGSVVRWLSALAALTKGLNLIPEPTGGSEHL